MELTAEEVQVANELVAEILPTVADTIGNAAGLIAINFARARPDVVYGVEAGQNFTPDPVQVGLAIQALVADMVRNRVVALADVEAPGIAMRDTILSYLPRNPLFRGVGSGYRIAEDTFLRVNPVDGMDLVNRLMSDLTPAYANLVNTELERFVNALDQVEGDGLDEEDEDEDKDKPEDPTFFEQYGTAIGVGVGVLVLGTVGYLVYTSQQDDKKRTRNGRKRNDEIVPGGPIGVLVGAFS